MVYVNGDYERIMSDVYDWVLRVVVIEDDGTYGNHSGSYNFEAKVDASPEQLQAYQDKLTADRIAELNRSIERNRLQEAKTLRNGKTVKVVRGRKVKIGTQGLLFWMGDSPWGKKVGIALSDKKDEKNRYSDVAWTYAANVEVVLDQQAV